MSFFGVEDGCERETDNAFECACRCLVCHSPYEVAYAVQRRQREGSFDDWDAKSSKGSSREVDE